ncbi:hypothetical protein FACHB389_29185 [Nostoc calcicola FACHB-389]|nr:hypothetical protein [Nostoc calcicola FACHB-3891]OKH26260.1 hypothetical protein FACHB389_29185 [Nostoc calcicola FACHB-389]
MKRLISATFATVALVVSLSNQAIAQSKSSPVPALLDRLGMTYKEQDGYFLVLAGVDGGRTQTGFILPEIAKIGDVEYIRVGSVSQISKTPPNAENTKKLQPSSFNDSLSKWTRTFTDEMYVTGYFSVVPLKSDSDSARQDIIKILNIADTAEKDLTGKDEF